MLYTTRALDVVLEHLESPVESLYVDAHIDWMLDGAKLSSLQYASMSKSLPNHPTHDAVFDNKYMKLFDARLNTIRTF